MAPLNNLKRIFSFETIPGALRVLSLFLIITPTLLFAFFICREFSYTRQYMLQTLEQTVALQRTMVDNWLDGHAGQIRTLSRLVSVKRGDLATFNANLATVMKNNPEYALITFVDAQGRAADGTSVADRDYFKAAQQGRDYMTDVLYGRLTGQQVILFTSPVYDFDGNFTGLVAGSVKLSTVTKMMEQFHFGQTGETYLVNRDGLMIIESRFGAELAKGRGVTNTNRPWLKLDTSGFRQALEGRIDSAVYTDFRGKRVFGAFSSVGNGRWMIIGEIDESEALGPVYSKIWLLVALNVALIALTTVLIMAFARRINRPVAILAEEATFIENGHYSRATMPCQFPADAPRELRVLHDSFDKMAERLINNIVELNALNTSLTETEERYRAMVENSLVGVYIAIDGKITYMNPKLQEIIGYSLEEAKQFVSFLDLVYPGDLPMVEENIRRRMAGEETSITYEPRIVRKDGSVAQLRIYATVCTIDGRRAITGTMIDVTEQKRWEKALKESEKRSRAIVEAIPDELVCLDGRGTIIEIISTKGSPSFSGPNAAHGKKLADIWPADIAEKAESYITQALVTGVVQVYEYELNFQGRLNSKEVRMVPAADDEVLLVIRDVTERKEMERKLEYMGYHDALTGLYNRAYFEQERVNAADGEGSAGIIVCDLDGLKTINDSLGHQKGDELLKAAAAALKVPGDNLVIARIGGDEFAVLALDVSEEQVETMCHAIVDNVVAHNSQPGVIPLSVSIGYAVGDKARINTVFRKADDMMYDNKSRRRQEVMALIREYVTGINNHKATI